MCRRALVCARYTHLQLWQQGQQLLLGHGAEHGALHRQAAICRAAVEGRQASRQAGGQAGEQSKLSKMCSAPNMHAV
jgi:hypothetical protein